MACIEHILITRVCTFYHVKLTQSTALSQCVICIDLSLNLPKLWLLLVFMNNQPIVLPSRLNSSCFSWFPLNHFRSVRTWSEKWVKMTGVFSTWYQGDSLHRREISTVPCDNSVFVYIIPLTKYHTGTRAKISFRCESCKARNDHALWNRAPNGVEQIAHA